LYRYTTAVLQAVVNAVSADYNANVNYNNKHGGGGGGGGGGSRRASGYSSEATDAWTLKNPRTAEFAGSIPGGGGASSSDRDSNPRGYCHYYYALVSHPVGACTS
jgi:hypothetical protein